MPEMTPPPAEAESRLNEILITLMGDMTQLLTLRNATALSAAEMTQRAMAAGDKARREIQELMLEVVGEDDKHRHLTQIYDEGCQRRDYRNGLRAEIRQKINEL